MNTVFSAAGLVPICRSDHPHHAVARAWLEHAATGAAAGSTLVLMPMVVASFLRLVTSPKIFKAPAPVDEAGCTRPRVAAPASALH